MTDPNRAPEKDRRRFIKEVAAWGGGAILVASASNFGEALAQAAQAGTSTSKWTKQMGMEVGNMMMTSTDPKLYESVMMKIAAIGYKEIEPFGNYCGMSPQDYRAMLDRCGVSMPSTHAPAVAGPDLEKTFEGYQVMGIKYTEVNQPGSNRGVGGGGRGPGAPGGAAGGAGGPGGGRGPGGAPPAQTTESVKRTAALDNENGKIAKKFGIKILIHNHTGEFQPLADNPNLTPYDIYLAETDPDVVAMQLDIGWASIAGQDVIGMFKKTPGRFELWHVKDALGLKHKSPDMTMAEQVSFLVPVGLGEVDYKTIFTYADLAGMKHFLVEQDNISAWGDEFAAAKVSYDNLVKMLS